MFGVIRRYSGVQKLIDELERRSDEVRDIMSSTPGFIAYYALREGTGLATVTVCDDREGTQETTRRAAAWVRDNLADARIAPPVTIGGEVFLSFTKEPARAS
jgi:hypothetical protein